MVLYRRVNERRLAAAREEGREEERKRLEGERRRLREWYDSLPKEFKDQLPPPF